MADQAITKFTTVGDVVLHYESPIVCMESGKVAAPVSGATDLDLAGYPVKGDPTNGYVLALEADSAAGITGFVAEQGLVNLAGDEEMKGPQKILARGPAAINGDKLPVNDVAGTPFTAANLIAAAEALGIQVRTEPVKQEVQTT